MPIWLMAFTPRSISSWMTPIAGSRERRASIPTNTPAKTAGRSAGWSVCMTPELTILLLTRLQRSMMPSPQRTGVLAHRALPDGGFSHGEHGSAGPYLGDTLFMGRAFLDLYAATADRAWLVRAGDAAKFIGAHFTSGVPAGFATIATSGDASFPPQPEVSENVIAARFFNLLAHYTGTPEHHRLAERAMQFLATPAIAGSPDAPVAGILLAVHEFSSDPLHVTVVGSKSSPAARALFDTAITAPAWYKRIEWFDAAEGPLPNPDVDYPQFKFPAAFLCTGNACSSPVRKPEALGAKLRQGN
jgi:uncharacterized protein YyaL (SSP411 family)